MQSDQDGHSKVQHQLLITLVHGTWGRGFFPRRQRPNRRPFWFEDGSPFLARLSTELQDIPHKIKPLFWSGENSIFERDKTAHVLAEHLSAEHAAHPQATQLVIAHSHGGNIALRALHHMSGLCGHTPNPLIATLATPFIEIHGADFGRRPFYIRLAMMLTILLPLSLALMFLLAVVALLAFPNISGDLVAVVWVGLGIASTLLMGYWWIVWRAPARRKRLDALKEATRIGQLTSEQRLLVIRAIDDEASLTLAFGVILNYVTARSIVYIVILSFSMLPAIGFTLEYFWAVHAVWISPDAFSYLIFPLLYSMFMLSRAVHGRELAVNPMECQINTQSTPDGVGLSKIITLVRRTYVKSLRHGIYDHEDCAKTVSDWVRFRLETN
jgi:hypothetical protein